MKRLPGKKRVKKMFFTGKCVIGYQEVLDPSSSLPVMAAGDARPGGIPRIGAHTGRSAQVRFDHARMALLAGYWHGAPVAGFVNTAQELENLRRVIKLTVAAGVITLGIGVFSSLAVAASPLCHLPLDGSLRNLGGSGGTPQMYVKPGEAAPTTVNGRIGQVLHFSGLGAVATPYDRGSHVLPAYTVTA